MVNADVLSRRCQGISRVQYASVADSGCAAGGLSSGVSRTTNIIVVPNDNSVVTLVSSKDTREALQKAIKPSDFNWRVKSLTLAKNNGVHIKTLSVDLQKMKDSIELNRAGLKL